MTFSLVPQISASVHIMGGGKHQHNSDTNSNGMEKRVYQR